MTISEAEGYVPMPEKPERQSHTCKSCWLAAHLCKSSRCECRCRELRDIDPEVATKDAWQSLEIRRAEIAAAMKRVERGSV